MATREPLNVLAACSCGMVLIDDAPEYRGGNPYWGHDFSDANHGHLPKVKCPGCGGDVSIPVGNHYHPRYFAEQQVAA